MLLCLKKYKNIYNNPNMDFDLANIELEIKEDIMREEAKIREEEKKKKKKSNV